MIILISAIVLVGVMILAADSYRELIRQKNGLDMARDYLENRLAKKCAFLEKLADTSETLMPREENLIRNLLKAKNKLAGTKILQAKAQAEAVADDIAKNLFAAADKHPELKSNEDFLRIRKQLDFIQSETGYAERFYNVNALDFNDGLGFPLKKIAAKILKYAKQEYFDPAAREENHPDYRAELEKHRAGDVALCKRRCAVCTYKKIPMIGYRRMVISIFLIVFIIGTACYTIYCLFRAVPMAQNIAAQLRMVQANSRPASSNAANTDSASWKMFNNGIFEIRYPRDWQLKQDETNKVSLRKTDTYASGATGLDIEMNIGRIGNPNNMSLMDVVSYSFMMGTDFSMPRNGGDYEQHDVVMVGGKSAMMMEHLLPGTKIYMKSYYWAMDKEIYYLDAVFYNNDHLDDQALAAKMLDTFRFLD